MRLLFIAAAAFMLCSCHSKMMAHTSAISRPHTDTRGNPMLLGTHPEKDLQQTPYQEWFDKNYADYQIDSATAIQLKPLVKNKQFEIFMGTWCGDSKREVPRMFKLLTYAGVPPSQIKLVMVDDHTDAYKQSPTHEEKGKAIHRVPDLIVYNGNKEMNRIVESPIVSLEKDLLNILAGNDYQPNYKGATWLAQRINGKGVNETGKDSSTLSILRPMLQRSAELNTLGYVWMVANETDKAMLAFQLNATLFPNEANVYDSLGEINMKTGNTEAARKYYSKVLALQPDNKNASKMLAQLH